MDGISLKALGDARRRFSLLLGKCMNTEAAFERGDAGEETKWQMALCRLP